MSRDKTALIIGGGRYGTRAVRYFEESGMKYILVDNDPRCEARKFLSKDQFYLGKAEDALELVLRMKPAFIIPAARGHVMGLWLKRHFDLLSFSEVVPEVMEYFPRSLIVRCDKAKAAIVFSYMPPGRLCEDSCCPPVERCPVTGEPRDRAVYELLNCAELRERFDLCKVFVSEQLTCGLGGVKGGEFLRFFRAVQGKGPNTLAVGTACWCHGILNFFRRKK